MKTYTHKTMGWTRTALGYGNWRIVPTDGTGDREVAFLSAHSWANLPNDDRANIDIDRVVLTSGEPLPSWAVEWLEKVNLANCAKARRAFDDAIADADWNEARREGW